MLGRMALNGWQWGWHDVGTCMVVWLVPSRASACPLHTRAWRATVIEQAVVSVISKYLKLEEKNILFSSFFFGKNADRAGMHSCCTGSDYNLSFCSAISNLMLVCLEGRTELYWTWVMLSCRGIFSYSCCWSAQTRKHKMWLCLLTWYSCLQTW